MSKKLVCYASNCCIVMAGFRLNWYPVCSTCKQEVSSNLAEHIDKYTRKEKKQDNSDLYPDYNYSDPTEE